MKVFDEKGKQLGVWNLLGLPIEEPDGGAFTIILALDQNDLVNSDNLTDTFPWRTQNELHGLLSEIAEWFNGYERMFEVFWDGLELYRQEVWEDPDPIS